MTASRKRLDIGPRLKDLRTARHMSLRELGAATGFSASFLSQVERGEASPSLSSLDKIARALGISLSGLLSEPGTSATGPLVRRHEQDTLRSEWSKATLQSLMPAGADERMSAFLVHLEPAGRTGRHFLHGPGNILGFCARGQPTLVLQEQKHALEPQDSVFYGADQLGVWENATAEPAEVVLVLLRPT